VKTYPQAEVVLFFRISAGAGFIKRHTMRKDGTVHASYSLYGSVQVGRNQVVQHPVAEPLRTEPGPAGPVARSSGRLWAQPPDVCSLTGWREGLFRVRVQPPTWRCTGQASVRV
jgi:hypothetical protein